ncbi:MAG: lamin tail domain-containing protein, partial [bacterium]
MRRGSNIAGAVFVAVAAVWMAAAGANGADVVINELLAINDSGRVDKYGVKSDWIELCNQTASPINLQGWYLTDDDSKLTKWVFPATNIPAYGYVVVVADGSTSSVYKGELHTTNFSLKGSGEYLALVWTNGVTVIDEYSPEFPAQSADVSYGIRADRLTRGYFATPTPGASNGMDGCTSMAGPPLFSVDSKAFTNGLTLSISNASGGIIRYTTDKSAPTEVSPQYTVPITISTSTLVRARVYATGMVPSPIVRKAYIKVASDLWNFTSDVPLVLIDSFGGGALPSVEPKTDAFMVIFEAVNGRSSVTNPPTLATRIGVRCRGESTIRTTYEKPILAVESRDENNLNTSISPLGLPPESDWVLYGTRNAGGNLDASLLRTPFPYRLSNLMGQYASRDRWAEVFINVDNVAASYASHYQGVYSWLERIKRADSRVDIHELLPSDTAEPDITGGYIVKSDKPDGGGDFSGGGALLWAVYPDMKDLTAVQTNWIKGHFDTFKTVLDGLNYTNPVLGYAAYIDVDSWIDAHILNVFTKNIDWPKFSTYMYKDRLGKIVMGPPWDFDRSADSYDTSDEAWNTWDGTLWSKFSGSGYPVIWYMRLLQDPDFWQKWVDRWQELSPTVLNASNICSMIDTLALEVRESHVRNFQKWSSDTTRGWSNEVVYLRDWLSNRVVWISGQFPTSPVITPASGWVTVPTSVTMVGHSGKTIYYTTNGTDPRASGGSVSASALTYSGPVTLYGSAVVVARCHDGSSSWLGAPNHSPWSGPSRAVFISQAPTLAVSEVMYNPRAPTTGTAETNYPASDFEFIELQNIGDETTSLAGVKFTDGVDFDFSYGSVRTLAPGEHVVVVKRLAAFTNRYSGWAGMRIAGESSDNLNNAGEEIKLRVPCVGLTNAVFTYNDGRGWPLAADGAGHSLVPLSSTVDSQTNGVLDYGGNWRASAYRDGSPGRADPEPVRDIAMNEVMSHTDYTNGALWQDSNDWIELFNASSNTVAFTTNWYLSDNADDLKKWMIPGSNSVASSNWITFFEVDGFHPATNSGFGLNKGGEEVYLSYLPG